MYERLEEQLRTTKALKWWPNRGVQEAWITEVEQELGFRLPPSYCWWLIHYGNGRLDGGELLSISPPEHREYADSDILYIHRLNREDEQWLLQFPHRVDLFVPDSDELYFFDTSTCDEHGEYPVMRYDLMNGIIEPYGENFAVFLENLLIQYRNWK